jgi:hypothetical protein
MFRVVFVKINEAFDIAHSCQYYIEGLTREVIFNDDIRSMIDVIFEYLFD